MATRSVEMTITYVAWESGSVNAGKTGDVGNHTLRWVKDGTSSAPTNSPSEIDSTNLPGLYKITLTSTETNCNIGVLGGKSSTANVSIVPITIQFERLPNAAPGATGGVPIGDSQGRVTIKPGGVSATELADDLRWLSASSFSYGQLSAVTSTSVMRLATGATAFTADDQPNDRFLLIIWAGQGVGGVAVITDYDFATDEVTLSPALTVLPNTSSYYSVVPLGLARAMGIGGAALAVESKQPSATAATNMTTVFDTDFAANYDTTNDKWKLDQVTLAKYVGLMVRKDAAIYTDLSTELGLINTDYASGNGTYDSQLESLEYIADKVNITVTISTDNNDHITNGTYGLSALETAISGISVGVNEATLAKYVGLIVRSDAGITTDLTSELALINTNYTSGAGSYAGLLQSQMAIASYVAGINDEVNNGTYGLSEIKDAIDGLPDASFHYILAGCILRKDAAFASDQAATIGIINTDYGSGAGSFDSTTDSQESIKDSITGGGGISEATLAKYVGLIVRSDTAISTDLSTELNLINTDYGTGAGGYTTATYSMMTISTHVDDCINILGHATYGNQAIRNVLYVLPLLK